jgi:hypothetical protein
VRVNVEVLRSTAKRALGNISEAQVKRQWIILGGKNYQEAVWANIHWSPPPWPRINPHPWGNNDTDDIVFFFQPIATLYFLKEFPVAYGGGGRQKKIPITK